MSKSSFPNFVINVRHTPHSCSFQPSNACTIPAMPRTHHPPWHYSQTLIISTVAAFQMYMAIHYVLPIKGFELVNKAFGGYFRVMYDNYDRKLKSVMRMVELYAPYLLFKGIFDDINTEELRRITSESFIEAEDFNFDPKCIDLEEYLINTHISGFLKHVLIK